MTTLLVCFLLGNSPASKFYMPTFRNTQFHLHKQVGKLFTYLPMKMEQTVCSETSAYKIQTPGNYPEGNIQHTEHGESSKSRIPHCLLHSKHFRFVQRSLVHCSDSFVAIKTPSRIHEWLFFYTRDGV